MFHFPKSGKAHSLGLKRRTSKSVRFRYLIGVKTFLVKKINSLTGVESWQTVGPVKPTGPETTPMKRCLL